MALWDARVLVRSTRSDPTALLASLAGYSTVLTAFLLRDSTAWRFAGIGLVFIAAIWWAPGDRSLTAIGRVVAFIYAVSIRGWDWSHLAVRSGIVLASIWMWLLRTPEASLAVVLAETLAVGVVAGADA